MPTIAIDPSASTPQEREHATKTKTPNMSEYWVGLQSLQSQY